MAAKAWGPTRFPVATVAAPTLATETSAVPTPSQAGAISGKALSLENPLLPLAGLVGITVGLVAFSTSVRVGSVRAAVSAGKQ